MIGLDSNVLVRYITQDDAAQSPRANRLIATFTEADPGFISTTSIVELVWVLESFYGFSNIEIAGAVQRLLSSDGFVVENERDVFVAMTALRGGADFKDAMIAASGKRVGCAHTATFDRKALRLAGFEPVA